MRLSQEALLELGWWASKDNLTKERSIVSQDPDLTMETDASMLGWGAVCRGIRTGGLWSLMERRNHISYLEPLAATFTVKSFARDMRNSHVHLRMENRTAVFYVNRMGGIHSLLMSNLAIQIWQWCLERNITLTAEHLPCRGGQCCGRRRVQNDPFISGMEATPRGVPTGNGDPWQM